MPYWIILSFELVKMWSSNVALVSVIQKTDWWAENGLISKKWTDKQNQIGFQKHSRTLVKKFVSLIFRSFLVLTLFGIRGYLRRLQKVGINGNFFDLIKYLYGKIKWAIKIKNRITGVRQGCPLSPVLCNLYINDIFDVIDKNSISDGYLDAKNKINALMYADDLVLISWIKEGLSHT